MKVEISYKKEYLPGYTGHVPKKNEIFGCTAGDINKILSGQSQKPSNFEVDIQVSQHNFAQRSLYSKPPNPDNQTNEIQFGNLSKYGQNWIGGPTNNIKAQHIPGYQGYVPNIKSENLFGRSYAKVTGQAINKEFIKGNSLPPKDRFQSQSVVEFSKDNFRRIKDEMEPAQIKDKQDVAEFHDAEFQGIEIKRKNIYLEMPTVGYQGFKSAYRPIATSINHRKDPFFNINPLRPRLKDINIQSNQNFATLSNGFQTALTSTKFREEAGLPDNQELKLPISGYTGHRMAYKAQNFYGKNYRDCAIQSKFVQKMSQ